MQIKPHSKHTKHNRELKHTWFWDMDGNRKWAIFTFDLPWHNHIPIAKYLSVIRDEWFKNLGDSTVLAHEIFSSGCCLHPKNARAWAPCKCMKDFELAQF